MAYNFATDTHCKALWKFEPGALTTDSKGSNTLVDVHDPVVGDVLESTDTGAFVESTGAAKFQCDADWNQSSFKILDANLDPGFPLKSGDTNKIISGCCWFKMSNYSGFDTSLFSKVMRLSDYTYHNSFQLVLSNQYVYAGFGKTTGIERQLIFEYYANVWQHIGWALDGINKTCMLRLWNGSSSTTYNTTFAEELNVTDADIQIGKCPSGETLLQDRMVIFDDLLTEAEIDAIRLQDYVAPPILNDAAFNLPTPQIDSTGLRTGGLLAMPRVEMLALATESGQKASMVLPGMSLKASAHKGCNGAFELPEIGVSGVAGLHGKLKMPKLGLSSEADISTFGKGNIKLHPLSIAGDSSSFEPGEGVFQLPRLKLSATAKTDQLGDGAFSLPGITMIPIASGDPGSQPSNRAYQSNRFDNYILRYTR